MGADAGYQAVFDRLFAAGSRAIRAGTHYRDTPPADGGRWGMSVVLLPDAAAMRRLAAITAEAMALAGSGHWATGSPEAVHFTVRSLEAHRSRVEPDDPLLERATKALAAATGGPVRLRLGGLTLTTSGVMACAFPVDGAAGEFAERLRVALGSDAWFDADYHRDIWYATLVHFTGDISDADGLVDWVAARRDLDLGVATANAADLIRFRHDGRLTVRVPLARQPERVTSATSAAREGRSSLR